MEKEIRSLIEKTIVDAGYILDDVTYVNENGANFLRIIIDKAEDYINVNDCVLVNDLLNPILDEMDLIEESYIVDICSKEKGCE